MFSRKPDVLSGPSTLSKRTAFWVLVGIGVVLAGSLLADAYVDWIHQGDPLWSTALENAIPILLAVALPYAGWRLLQSAPDSMYLPEAVRWTLVGCSGMIVLSGLVMGSQLLQQEIKPAIIILQLATVGAIAGLWVGYNLARTKEAEQKAQEDRDRLANLLDGLPAPVVHGKFEGDRLDILRTNPAFGEVFGQEIEEVEGRDLYDIVVAKEKREEAADIDRQAIEEGLVEREVRRQTAEGPRDFQLRVAHALDEGASETYAIYTDITEQKKRERELGWMREQIELALKHTDSLLFGIDLETRSVWRRGPFKDFFGLEAEEVSSLESFVEQAVHPEDRERFREFYGSLAGGKRAPGEFEYRTNPEIGSCRWIRDNVYLEDTGSRQVVGLAQDVTQRKERKEELRLFEQAIEQANDAVLVTEARPINEPGPRIEYVNTAFEEMTGYSREEVLGKTPRILQGPETDREVLDSLREALGKGESWSGETTNYRKDGTPFLLRWSIAPVENAEDEIEHWVSVQRDVSRQRKREQEIKHRSEAMKAASDGMAILDEEGVYTYVNQAHADTYGYDSPEAFLGETWRICYGEEERQRFEEEVVPKLFEEGTWRGEALGKRADGSRFPQELTLTALENGGIICVVRDITDRIDRERELRRAKEKAEEASRLRSAMLANMSHEVRTPLTSILGFSEILKDQLEGALEAHAERIHEGSQRLQRTLDSVLHLSKLEAEVEELACEDLALEEVVSTVTEMLRPQANKKSLTVETEDPGTPVVGHWNEDAVHRICRNLLENAIKFTPENGQIEVRVREEEGEAVLEVEDTGIGMAPENVPELFKAFKQESEGLAREYEGTGLGLSIVKRLTDELGGTVEVDTKKGEGTCFTVRLPQK